MSTSTKAFTSGWAVGFEQGRMAERRRIRRRLKPLRGWIDLIIGEGTVLPSRADGLRAALEAIDRATKAPKRKR